MNWPKFTLSFHALILLALLATTFASLARTSSLDQGSLAQPSLAASGEPDAPFSPWDDAVSDAASEPPELTIVRSQDEILIGWPLAATGWVLEQSPNLRPPISWAQVPPPAYQVNATNISLPLSVPAENMFYRLRKLGPAIPGLTGNWTLDEGQGQSAQDSSGNENSLSLSNVTWTVGRIGPSALWFDGKPVGAGGGRAWVSNANYRVLPPTGQPFSVSLWFNPDTLTNAWCGLLGNDANGSNGWHLALHNAGPGTNELIFASAGVGASLSVTGRTLLLPGRWYELSATYDGAEGIIYLDSELLARGSGTLLANNQPIYFGGGVGVYDGFPGRIDEVRTCTNALTAEAISLAGQWHFDENGGTFITDTSIRGHHATLSTSTAWASGKDGSGINLSSSTMLIRNDYADLLPPTGGSFSLSFWLYPKSALTGWNGLMSCADGTNTGWSLALYAEALGRTYLHFWSTNSGGTLDLGAPIALPEQVWSKLDLTFNGGIATLYLNGLKVKSDTGGIQGNTAPLVVGTAPGMTNFNGVMDELKIYRRERGEAEVGPVAKVMWETVLVNTATNLVLQGFGAAGKPLTYSIVGALSPTNGTLNHAPGSPIVTYTAGTNKGPDAFTYSVSDGEFTSPPTIVSVSVVRPHWLSPTGGMTLPLDGTAPPQAWLAGPSGALDAIWRTNQYYDCFFYAPGEYQTTGSKWGERRTANPGCKHVGSGSAGPNATTLKLVNILAAAEDLIFGGWTVGAYCDGFEVHDLVLDCNAMNNPKYTQGEPISITIPLLTTSRVDSITLHWYWGPFNGIWQFGAARNFSVCTRVSGTNDYVTNCVSVTGTGADDKVILGVVTDEIVIRLEKRAPGVDFYSLADIEVAGAAVSVPTATASDGTESRLDSDFGNYSIMQAVDRDTTTAWASGPEATVRVVLPLAPGTTISQVNFLWNCKSLDGVGRLGPAADYRFQARDPNTQDYYDVPFVRQPRTATGLQINNFGTAQTPATVTTDRLAILLNSRELGVDFYSLAHVGFQNGSTQIPLKLPSATSELTWGNYQILRAFDGLPATQWTCDSQDMIGAMNIVGNNVKLMHLKVVGFGTKAVRECFPMGVGTPPAWAPPVRYGNVLVEDCVFTDPATNNTDGLTTLVVAGVPPHSLTNAVIRRCTVAGVKPYFRYSHGFSAVEVENCLVQDCGQGVYFEPNPDWGDSLGSVLIRSNLFLNVDDGVFLLFAAAGRFASLTCLGNEIVVSGAPGWGLVACDTCSQGLSGSITNLTALNNLVRYGDWSLRPANSDGGLHCSDIHNAVFGNNIVVLGTAGALRLRGCPSGFIPSPPQTETCDFPVLPPPPPPSYPPCLDALPPGYRRGWFNNRDLQGNLLNVRYTTPISDGFAAQQQWP